MKDNQQICLYADDDVNSVGFLLTENFEPYCKQTSYIATDEPKAQFMK